MKDRQPTRPGRVKITPENGAAYYAVMEMADEPTEVGTPPTKANLLKDTTAALLGGDDSMVPDEALVALKGIIDGLTAADVGAPRMEVGSYTGTEAYGESNPIRLTFSFQPKFVLVAKSSIYLTHASNVYPTGYFVWTPGVTRIATYAQSSTAYWIYLTLSGNTLSWYATKDNKTQLNEAATYYYVAIG